jgi:hypothetical protein
VTHIRKNDPAGDVKRSCKTEIKIERCMKNTVEFKWKILVSIEIE